MTSRTKPLCTCTSIPCFRSATGASTCSLVGRPSTRGRIYVAFGEHPTAGGLYVFFGTRGSHLGPECHFRLPRGVFLALWVTWGCTVALVFTLLDWGTFPCLSSTLRDLGAPVWHHWASFWVPWDVIFMLFHRLWACLESLQTVLGKEDKK